MTSQTVRPVSRAVAIAAAVDLVAVLVFATAGRDSHAEGVTPTGVLSTAAPFLVGLLLGWLVARAWRAPLRLPVGVAVWAVTVVAGLAVRTAFTHRLPVTFVLVAGLTLAVFLLGWRLVAFGVTRAARTRRPSA